MLHAIASANLRREPRNVRVMHHDLANVALIAISYEHLPPHSTEKNYVTVAELQLPYDSAQPLHVQHLEVPGVGVSSFALTRSVDGEQALLLVQCLFKKECAAAKETAETYVFRRASGYEAIYVRLPRPVPTAGRIWTAAASLHSPENAVEPTATQHSMSVLAASGSGLLQQPNALQCVRVLGTKSEVPATVEIPALSAFEVGAVLPISGTGGAQAVLMCHHLLLQVDLRATLSTTSTSPTSSSNAVVRRTWRWSPHDQLTSCCLVDHLLVAGTEDGNLVLWDSRADDADTPAARTHCPTGSDSAITGLHAPNAACIVSCALNGDVWGWQVPTDGPLPAVGAPSFPYVRTAPVVVRPHHSTEERCAVVNSKGGCLGMSGDGNLVAVIREYGGLEVYVCV